MFEKIKKNLIFRNDGCAVLGLLGAVAVAYVVFEIIHRGNVCQ